MHQIQGTAYAPGQASGKICRNTENISDSYLLLLKSDQLGVIDKLHIESKPRPAGLVLIDAMPLSHIMIRLLGLGIPMVTVTSEQARLLVEGDEMVIDGNLGTITAANKVIVNTVAPSSTMGKAILTSDGETVSLRTSLGDAKSAKLAKQNGASAIGLLRSELLGCSSKKPPDSTFYYHALREICLAAHPLSVAIRLLDIAPDKKPAWLPEIKGTHTPLGLQGTRLYNSPPVRRVVDAELMAIAQLAEEFSISLLLPYITHADEFLHWHNEFANRLPSSVKIGAVAETPIAALAIDELFQHTDLVAFGCNDLMQCLCAASRVRVELSSYLNPYTPGIFRFFQLVAQIAHEKVGGIQLCGLLPQMPGIMSIMLGLGYRTFSVEVQLIPHLAQVIRSTNTKQAAELARKICEAPNSVSVHRLLNQEKQITEEMA